MPAGRRRWLLLAAAAVLAGAPWTGYALRDVHVDTTATALSVLSCWCLVAARPGPGRRWAAAGLAVLAVWTKQIEVGVPVAQLLWFGWTGSARAAGRYALQLLAAGLLAMSLLPDHPATVDIVWRMTLCGLGFGFFNTPNNRAIILSAPPVRTGGAHFATAPSVSKSVSVSTR